MEVFGHYLKEVVQTNTSLRKKASRTILMKVLKNNPVGKAIRKILKEFIFDYPLR